MAEKKQFEFKKASDALEAIGDIVSGNPEMWAQGWYAYDKNGISVGAQTEEACQWCVHGFLKDAPMSLRVLDDAALALTCVIMKKPDHFECDFGVIEDFNDKEGRNVRHIYTAFYKAAEFAKAKGL